MVDNDLPGDAPDIAEDASAVPAKPAPRRGPHRDMRDTVAEMAERAQQISMEAGSKIASAMKDVIAAGAGMAGFAIESARDVVQYMVRRGQMTPEEAERVIREAEEAHAKRSPEERARPTASKIAADKAAAAKAAAALNPPPPPVHRPFGRPAASPARPASPAPAPTASAPPKSAPVAAKKDAPAASAPKSPAAKAPAVKAPASKAATPKPAAKAPAKKAPPAKSPSKSAAKATSKATTAKSGAAKKSAAPNTKAAARPAKPAAKGGSKPAAKTAKKR